MLAVIAACSGAGSPGGRLGPPSSSSPDAAPTATAPASPSATGAAIQFTRVALPRTGGVSLEADAPAVAVLASRDEIVLLAAFAKQGVPRIDDLRPMFESVDFGRQIVVVALRRHPTGQDPRTGS